VVSTQKPNAANPTSLPLNYQPGTAWQYSNATDVVGRLVEVISGQPLGMSDTHFYVNKDKGQTDWRHNTSQVMI